MDHLKTVLHYQLLSIEVWVYAASFTAIFAGFGCKKLTEFIFSRFIALSRKTKFTFDDLLLVSLQKPAEWGCVIGGLYLSLRILPLPTAPVDIHHFVSATVNGSIVALIIWFAIRLADGIADLWELSAKKTESKLDDQLVPIVRRSSKVFFAITGVVLVLQNMGYSVGSLLAGLGIGGLAIAMASKDTVSNLFGSLVIFLDKPFHIGDWIESDSIEGTVEEIGLRTTRIRTFANSLITMPNALFTTKAINNWSRMKKRRIKMTVGVTYDSSPQKVNDLVLAIRELIKNDPNLHSDFYLVNFDTFGPSSLDIFIYCVTVTTNWGDFLQAKQEFMLQIMQKVTDLGLSFAFPTQTVHIEPPTLPAGMEAMQQQRPN